MASRPSKVLIHLEHLRENYRQLRRLTPHEFFCPMIKAEAYGHGAVRVAQVLEELGCRQIGVALLEEALQLRAAGIQQSRIYVLGGFRPEDVSAIIDHHLTPIVGRIEDLDSLATRTKSPIAIHLKFNTGMNRLGFELEDVDQIKRVLARASHLHLEAVASHFQNGADAGLGTGLSAPQMERIRLLGQIFPVQVHALNSSALISLWAHGRLSDHDWGARPGIALYGLLPDIDCANPAAQSMVKRLNLQPVLSLESQISRYHVLETGQSVSYAGTWRAPRPSRIAVVPVGYGDGYPRILSNRAQVLVKGRRCAVIGNVTMDYILVDVTDVEGLASSGERVILIGGSGAAYVGAKELAELAGTIDYEIVTRLSYRLPRHDS